MSIKRVALYIRVSSDKQAQEGDSIPAQRDALQKYIADHGDMVSAGEYLDDGISGTGAIQIVINPAGAFLRGFVHHSSYSVSLNSPSSSS